MEEFLQKVIERSAPNPEDEIFNDIWTEYERVIIHSLITTFGLDFLVHDSDGGDVDTVNNIRNGEEFKNKRYTALYENRGNYNPRLYHNDKSYRGVVSVAKKEYQNEGILKKDEYDENNMLHFSRASGVGPWRRANLDHVISAHEIHDDPVRFLSGRDAISLANDPENLRFTSEALNKKMSDYSVEEFLEIYEKNPEKMNWNGEINAPMPEEVRQTLLNVDKKVREHYDRTIEKEYYSSRSFYNDVSKAASKVGVEMGIRQALGLVFLEIWLGCKKEIQKLPAGCSFTDVIDSIILGVEEGAQSAIKKYDRIMSQFAQGFLAGLISSVTTTILNIFVTTKKDTVKFIRYGTVAVVQAGNVLLVNPNDLLLGEQLKVATITLATGASNIAGSYVGGVIEKSSIGKIPEVGHAVAKFISLLVSGMISCTLTVILDRSFLINGIIQRMNQYMSDYHVTKEISEKFVAIGMELGKLDIEEFMREAEKYKTISTLIVRCDTEEQLESELFLIFKSLNIEQPWDESFDEFMNAQTTKLKFD